MSEQIRLQERKEVYGVVRDNILRGVWLPGQIVTDQALAERVQKPRKPVREALAVLEATGLIRHVPNAGVEVRRMIGMDALQSIKLRGSLEVESAWHGEDPINESSAELYDAQTAMTKARAQGEQLEFMLADTRFHVELMRLRGYRGSLTAMQGFRDRIHLYRLHNDLPLAQPEMTDVVNEHSVILSAAERGNRLAEPLLAHLVSTYSRIKN